MEDSMREALRRIKNTRSKLSEILDLSGLNLSSLPESIGQLTQLTRLYLYDNQLTILPESIGQLTQLTRLSLHDNQLAVLPESISQLTQLTSLSLHDNQLAVLPESISQLTQLTELDLSTNQLTVLPESIGQLNQLTRLDLHTNQLTVLPESIGQLTQLTRLDLSNNQLTDLPESIGQLTQLTELDLPNNQLTDLPESIGQLTQLTELDLRNNELTTLPESIGQLTQLRELSLHTNELTVLPKSLQHLTLLRLLDLRGNTDLGIPPEVIEDRFDSDRILDYYFRLLEDRRPLNEAKLILVGRGEVGKTSLVNRLVYNQFNQGEEKTEGISITKWDLMLHGHEAVRLNIWDFGGQEIMHATHQFFLTQRSLYVLVLNGRQGNEEAEAEYWLKLIDSFSDNSPVVVVLNKIKEHPFDVNRRGLQQKYPHIRGFVKTDCKYATGIDELKKVIERETDQLEHLRDAFPASWFQIKDRLSSQWKNYLSFDEYRAECEMLGEQDPAAQESLAFYLHSLGIALNYKDDPRLQDTHVLNPHWVTNGIYKILNSEQVDKQKGELSLNLIAQILDRNEYPFHMHRFLLDLMRKFELCFRFPEDDNKYLIPELLEKNEAQEAEEFEPKSCLNFQYHYIIIPEGLLPRFIVRTHSLSTGLPRWRTGVILEFEKNRALVKADIQDKKVLISVDGPMQSRRRLLAIIRSDFDRIHGDIRNLQPQEMIPVPDRPALVIPYKKLQVLEEKKLLTYTEVEGDDIIDINVNDLLNGVDLEGTRSTKKKMESKTESIRIFYSYSHKDETLRNELETHLKLLQRQRLIDSWNDRDIDAGDDWKAKIDENLERADIILLLVSADFIASDYCYEKEMDRALERHQNGQARVIPIIVRDVNWRSAPFSTIQALPKDGKAVMEWTSKDAAWRNVSEGIEKVVKQMRKGQN
ncbi:putative serine/threonine-protein kinase pats1 [Fibrisoma limi BUZ 3]|uniref:non-specific serine/threonine protein kinase n=1 Tax=Fibrisoma limi BUZ 3 TaxID=1185876 RepID=I2GJA4_9BACT|nr:COR domain-containing protein [Fibrisoma limi]CCH53979.1 putative serine/threonine-protein kinase pats1 [Fibrisoma limi BUZ 3]